MFAGDDADSVLSYDPSLVNAPPPRRDGPPQANDVPEWAKRYVDSAPGPHSTNSTLARSAPGPGWAGGNGTRDDRDDGFRRTSRMEDEFGWSGSAGGIRGRDDRQIKRDAEFERQIEERRRKRKERKRARELGLPDPSSNEPSGSANGNAPASGSGKNFRPVFAPTDQDLAQVDEAGASPPHRQGVTLADRRMHTRAKSASAAPGAGRKASPPASGNLRRGKSLKEKVGAALGRFGSRRDRNSTPPARARASTTGGSGGPSGTDSGDLTEEGEQGAHGAGADRGLGGLVRKMSRKLTEDAAAERRRRERDQVYHEPPKLSHVLVGAHSPYPMRPPLSSSEGQQPPPFGSVPAPRVPGHSYTRSAYERRELQAGI